MVNKEPGSGVCMIARRLASVAGLVGLLAMLSACSSTTPAPPSEGLKGAELHFSLDQCQPLGADLYKCPAIDKPICGAGYNGTEVNCVRIGPNGSVYVQGTHE